MQMSDVNLDLAGLISSAKVFGGSDNIRHGTYKFLIERIFAQKMDSGRFAIAEFKVLESAPNPQTVGSDDGLKPNAVGSRCALKVNFDGPGAKSAPGNVKAFILGLFGKNEEDISEADVNTTWVDLSRNRDEMVNGKLKKGNPARGMVIGCTTFSKEKRKTKLLPGDQKEYITGLKWICVSPPGSGENAPEKVSARTADLDHGTAGAVAAPVAAAPVVAPPMPPMPPAPPVPGAEWAPPAPWRVHPSVPAGNTPDTRWYWDGGTGVKTEAQLRAGQ
jgi:hypothetical protein